MCEDAICVQSGTRLTSGAVTRREGIAAAVVGLLNTGYCGGSFPGSG